MERLEEQVEVIFASVVRHTKRDRALRSSLQKVQKLFHRISVCIVKRMEEEAARVVGGRIVRQWSVVAGCICKRR